MAKKSTRPREGLWLDLQQGTLTVTLCSSLRQARHDLVHLEEALGLEHRALHAVLRRLEHQERFARHLRQRIDDILEALMPPAQDISVEVDQSRMKLDS